MSVLASLAYHPPLLKTISVLIRGHFNVFLLHIEIIQNERFQESLFLKHVNYQIPEFILRRQSRV